VEEDEEVFQLLLAFVFTFQNSIVIAAFAASALKAGLAVLITDRQTLPAGLECSKLVSE